MVGLVGPRHVQVHDVGPLEQLVQGDQLDRPAVHDHVARVGVIADDFLEERAGALHDRAADAAHADDAEGQFVQAADGHEVVTRPFARADLVGGEDELAHEGQDERGGVVGDLVGTVLGGVGDGDPALPAVLQVNVVHADAVARDHLQVRALVHDGGGGWRPLRDDGDGIYALDGGEHFGLGGALRTDEGEAGLRQDTLFDIQLVCNGVVRDENVGHDSLSPDSRKSGQTRSATPRLFSETPRGESCLSRF